MNLVQPTKLALSILAASLAIILGITSEASGDSNTPKKPAPTQFNQKNSVVTPSKNRPPILEGSKPSNPIPAKDKPNNPPVSIPEVVKPTPVPLPTKPKNPPVSIPEVVKPKPIPLPTKPNNPPVSTPEVVKPTPVPLTKKPANPPVAIPEVAKPKPTPLPTKPANPPVAIPEVVKPTPVPLPTKPNNPPVSIPEIVKPTPKPVPLRMPVISDKKSIPQTPSAKVPMQELSPIRNNQRNALNNQSFYHQQTARDFYEHTRKYPTPLYTNQGYFNNNTAYSWLNNNCYFYGYNYRNYSYITCYDRFNNRFSIISVPNENLNYPVVIQPYPPVMIQPYPVNYYQTFDTTGFLSPILMLLRITQGNYIW